MKRLREYTLEPTSGEERDRTRSITFRGLKESGVKWTFFLAAAFSVIVVFFILFFLFGKGHLLFTEDGVGLGEFLTGDRWLPTASTPRFGAFPLIAGTLLVTLGAMAIAIPLGIGSAIYISQLAPPRVKDLLKTGIELLSGIPSVVFGLFGLMVLKNWIEVGFDRPVGLCWLGGSIILGIMALPTIITVAEDAISSVSREQKEASLALGATKWQSIRKVILPASISGITAATILGMGRAIGETIVVWMVTGNAAVLPVPITNVFYPIQPITAALATEIPEAPLNSPHEHSLYALAIILFVMVLAINSLALYVMKRLREKHCGISDQTCKIKKTRVSFTISPATKDLLKRGSYFFLLLLLLGILVAWFGIIIGVASFSFLIIFYLIFKNQTNNIQQKIAFAGVNLSAIVVVLMLGTILYYIIANGIGEISWEFLTTSPRGNGLDGGIFQAIIGTLYLVGGAILFALPLGIGAGIYLSEYAKEGRVVRIVRAGIDNLNGTPSIVFGLFGYTLFVLYFGWGFSLIAGQITLGLMILPTIIRTAEEALKAVPQSVREGSLALGATKWQTIKKVVLPPASPGIVTGAILGIGRAGGETAPILFTAVTWLGSALPYYILVMAMDIPGGMDRAAGAALVLLLIVLGIFGTAAVLRNRFRKATKW